MVTVKEPRHPTSEAYRSLRTNLQFSALDTNLRTMSVTSANPSEGKTTTAVNLAIVMAQAGHSVALVDADLRRPRVHKLFGVNNSMGLTDAVVHSDMPATHYLRPTDVENLQLMTSGKIPPNPAELLGSRRMSDLLERLKEAVDVVICDTPPILAVTDAAIVGRQVDGVLMVMNAGKTRMDSAIQATQSLRKVNCHLLGAVLNRLERSTRGYYYYYDGYYTSDDVDDDSSDKSKRSRTSRKGGSSSPKSALEGTVNLAKPEK
jgi:capsular exopolysaccharide synthesis family protein